jgi:hypothetical protein
MLKFDTVCTLGKSLRITRTKDAATDEEIVTCSLSFSGLTVIRSAIDWLLSVPEGWADGALYDELGAPIGKLTIAGVRKSPVSVTGTIRGAKADAVLKLMQADLASFELQITPLGALVSGELKWQAAGDEVEDVTELLGRICGVSLELRDAGQADLLT